MDRIVINEIEYPNNKETELLKLDIMKKFSKGEIDNLTFTADVDGTLFIDYTIPIRQRKKLST